MIIITGLSSIKIQLELWLLFLGVWQGREGWGRVGTQS